MGCVSSALRAVLGITKRRNAVSDCASAGASSKGRLASLGCGLVGAVDVRGLVGVVRLVVVVS
jgi:hypothetical protein